MSEAAGDGRLRLTIVGGFLGSGKTTWLRHQLFEGRFAKAHVLVNEAAGTPVDHSLLGKAHALTVLAGGCACCEGQAQFQDALLQICDARSQTTDNRVAEIVLETSGLADPAAIVDLIQSHPVLIRHIIVAEVMVIVDAHYGLKALETHPLARAQISAAHALVLNKTDLTAPDTITTLRHVMARLAPGAVQSGAAFGSPVDLPPDLGAPPPDLPVFDGASSPPITVSQLDLGSTPDWTALTLWLSALLHARGDQIVRVKGAISSPAGRLLIQAVRKTVQSPEVLPQDSAQEDSQNQLVLIGSGMDEDALRSSFERVCTLG